MSSESITRSEERSNGRTFEGDEWTDADPLVEVSNLQKYFYENDSLLDTVLGNEQSAVRAVDGVSFDIQSGETLGLVGESGCGKSTTGETVLRLQEPTDGEVRFRGQNIFEADSNDLKSFRQEAQVVFQDPFSSLNPRMSIGKTVEEPLEVHGIGTSTERRERVESLLERVGLSADQYDRYPHEFSGGQRQRIGIARALALEPEFVVLDEPTSALDVSVQAQILNLLADLQDEFGLTYLLISHDLSVIRHICDRVAVMYLGEIVEVGAAETVFESPDHPYTQALLESVPRADTDEQDREIETISGDVPSPRNPPSGCRFRTRCPQIIPPEGVEMPASAFRSIATLRERISTREISLSAVWEDLNQDPGNEDLRQEHRREFAELLADDILDESVPDTDRQYILDALEELAVDDWEAAAELLRTEYESICELENPELGENDHQTACHLYDTDGTRIS